MHLIINTPQTLLTKNANNQCVVCAGMKNAAFCLTWFARREQETSVAALCVCFISFRVFFFLLFVFNLFVYSHAFMWMCNIITHIIVSSIKGIYIYIYILLTYMLALICGTTVIVYEKQGSFNCVYESTHFIAKVFKQNSFLQMKWRKIIFKRREKF